MLCSRLSNAARFVCAVALCLIVLSTNTASVGAQIATTAESRLYYACKVWGYLKYFHPAVDGCSRNMDSILVAIIPDLEDADDSSFNASLMKLFAFAGPMPAADGSEWHVPDSDRVNLDLRWHDDPALSAVVRALLDSIRIHFRPRGNCYFTRSGSTIVQAVENAYGKDSAMRKPYRLLTLFRGWSIYNYFSPYKNVLDRAWDSVLTDMIPRVVDANDPLAFHLALVRMQVAQDDAHAAARSELLLSHFGTKYLPLLLAVVEGKTIVRKVFERVEGIKPGDVLISIDGITTEQLRDSLERYTSGGNDDVVNRNICRHMLRGATTSATLTVDDGSGSRSVTIERNATIEESGDSLFHWSIGVVPYRLAGDVGYVNCGMLNTGDIEGIRRDLLSASAIIIDVRNYPVANVYPGLCNALKNQVSPFSYLTYPNVAFPGTTTKSTYMCGTQPSAVAYDGQVILLVNEVTQSAAEFATMALSTVPGAITIGSTTAGADGNVVSFVLPTDFTMYYTALGVYYPDGAPTQRVGLKIDRIVRPTIAGIRAGRDEVLEAALDMVSGVTTTETRTSVTVVPNPARENITISDAQGIARVVVSNALGVTVYESRPSNVPTHTIDMSPMSSGLYFVSVRAGGVTTTSSLIRN